jgi:S1-C subfamily serine protease
MLKQFLAFFITLIVACSSAAKAPLHPAPNPSNMELYKSIARVSLQADGLELRATAFAIDADHLITAGHVCADAQSLAIDARVPADLKIEYIDDEDLISSIKGSQIIKVDPVSDLCLLRRPGHPLKPLALETDPKKVKRFDRIFMAGAPWGEFPMVEECFVSSLNSEDQKDEDARGWLTSSCSAKPGYSGGPMIRNGKVVSVVSRGKAILWPIGSAYITFGTPTASILEFVKFIK